MAWICINQMVKPFKNLSHPQLSVNSEQLKLDDDKKWPINTEPIGTRMPDSRSIQRLFWWQRLRSWWKLNFINSIRVSSKWWYIKHQHLQVLWQECSNETNSGANQGSFYWKPILTLINTPFIKPAGSSLITPSIVIILSNEIKVTIILGVSESVSLSLVTQLSVVCWHWCLTAERSIQL